MADVLSQAQIDALLNAVRSGDKDLEDSGEKQEKKYLKYDFSSPRKFTKDRIKMLNGIFDNYSRVISSRLNARLRSTCEITVESIEEQRYYEFSNALTEGDVLGAMTVSLEGEELAEVDLLAFTSVEASRIRVLWRDVKEFFSTTAAKAALGVVLVLAAVLGGWKLLFSRRRYRYGPSVRGGGRRGAYRGPRRRR